MRTYTQYFLTLIITSVCAGLVGCDAEKNMPDPDAEYFIKYYGGDGNQHGTDMEVLPDGTFFLIGNYAENTFDTDLYLMRVNAEGDVLWEQRFGSDQQNAIWNARDIEPTNDGNYIVLADFRPNVNANSDFGLLKFSPDGALLDSAMVRLSIANEFSKGITPLTDGGFIVSGTTEFTATFSISGHPDPDFGDIFDYRVDANLDRVPKWSPIYTGFGAHLDATIKIVEIPSATKSTFYAYGFTNSQIAGDQNVEGRLGLFYFFRDSTGTTGDVYYPGNAESASDTEIVYVEKAPPPLGTGVIVLGKSMDDFEVSDIFLGRLRASLTFRAQDVSMSAILPLSRNIRAVSACPSISGELGYLVLGNEIRGIQTSNIWLSKVDQSGHVLWSTSLGSEGEDDMGAAVAELPDGKIVVLGTAGLADNQFKMALIKMNRTGQFLK